MEIDCDEKDILKEKYWNFYAASIISYRISAITYLLTLILYFICSFVYVIIQGEPKGTLTESEIENGIFSFLLILQIAQIFSSGIDKIFVFLFI